MIRQQYRRDSLIGRIYYWAKDSYPNTDTCDVRSVVFVQVPLLVVFCVFWGALFTYMVAYFVAWLYTDFLGPEGFGLILVTILIYAWGMAWLKHFDKRKSVVIKMRSPRIIRDLYESAKDKLCKPVEWVD